MFHIIHPAQQNDLESCADDLVHLAAFFSYALDSDEYTGDAAARHGASLLADVLRRGVADLHTLAVATIERKSAEAFALGMLEGRGTVPARSEHQPQLTEPAPSTARQKRAG